LHPRPVRRKYYFTKYLRKLPLGLSELCRADEALRELVNTWHRLTPEVSAKIIELARGAI
jgi:hypothetical protein